ncbi:hypothetical protein [Streptomyces sp. ME02-6979.5a]|uniref:hypothetical protein n=1 Tax=Streptomyces sp. ME02-6979.5a TaxID=462925 RepID=UPI0029CA8E7C|nr:hypothetical protein [Streptomyces sp. ME02-6979.5a]
MADWTHKQGEIPEHSGGVLPPTGTLGEIAEKYDGIAKLVELDVDDDLTETGLLASLLVIRSLREKLQEDERRLIAAARRKKVTWTRLADALELRSRQAAERRFLQLRSDFDESAGAQLTQQSRIDFARDQRSRRAERDWAIQHADEIRHLAHRLLHVPDVQQRADRSASARRAHATAVRSAEQAGAPMPQALPAKWPARLRALFDEDVALLVAPAELSASDLDPGRLKTTRVANSVHQLSGALENAASPDNIDLTDQEGLGPAIAALFASRPGAVFERG